MNHLKRKARCLCGKMKKITWINGDDFKLGFVLFAIGHSECKKCEVMQLHFSGDPVAIDDFTKNNEDFKKFNNIYSSH